jgi:hypothetical protein
MSMDEKSPRDGQSDREISWVNPADLREGPLQREALSPPQLARARSVYAALGRHLGPFEKFELGFLRDAQPDSEIAIWEVIAGAFQQYRERHPKMSEAEEDALFNGLLILSLGAEKPKNVPQELWDELRTLVPWQG